MNPTSSEEWHIATGRWSIEDGCCFVNLCPGVFIATHLTVTNWSSLEACLRSVGWFKVWVDLNMLNHVKVIQCTEPIWNICIIWYFSSVINSNNHALAEKMLVGAKIQTYDLQDGRRARYQLSYAASLLDMISKLQLTNYVLRLVTKIYPTWRVKKKSSKKQQ